MQESIKTVFFGPFFGELGWELAHWHGWVKKMCREKYQSFRKIASSYPGRELFYPDVDEFWPHPAQITNLKISQRGYIADYWFGNFPKPDAEADIDKNIGWYVAKLLAEYKTKLPKDTKFYVPHRLNVYRLNGKRRFIGSLLLKWLPFDGILKFPSPPQEHQIFERLKPSPKGEDFFKENFGSGKKIIAVFPRHRQARRPDKNWPKENYDLLIKKLQADYPNLKVAVLGEPGGAYYTEGVPAGCLDLISLAREIRLDTQLAALQNSVLAIGSVSGAMRVAALASCPLVEWGHKSYQEVAMVKQNFLKSKVIFLPEANPSVEKIKNIIDLTLRG